MLRRGCCSLYHAPIWIVLAVRCRAGLACPRILQRELIAVPPPGASRNHTVNQQHSKRWGGICPDLQPRVGRQVKRALFHLLGVLPWMISRARPWVNASSRI